MVLFFLHISSLLFLYVDFVSLIFLLSKELLTFLVRSIGSKFPQFLFVSENAHFSFIF